MRNLICMIMVMGILITSVIFSSESSETGAKKLKVLRYALHTSKLGSLDPHFSKGSQDATYTDLVFNGLLRYKPGNSKIIEPDLALELPRFDIVNSRQIWTIRLRQGVYFHESPGFKPHELTSRDVVFSLKKATDPETCSYSGLYKDMSFEIVDRFTLKIILKQPISPLFFFPKITNVKGGVILSRKVIEQGGYDAFLAHPVGTGPFQFKTYTPGERLVLSANLGYFRGKPKLDGVEVYFMPENQTREAAFNKNMVDVIYGSGKPGWLEKMEKLPNTKVDVFGPGYTGMFHFNTAIKPLDDLRVRQAIFHALDRKKLMAVTSKRLVSPVYAPMSPAFLPGLSNTQVAELKLKTEPNLRRAKELLALAGMEKGFSLTLPVSEKRLYQQTYGVLKTELAKVNIQVNLKKMSHSLYHKQIRENTSPIVLYFTFRPDADSYLRGFFHSDSIVKTGKNPHTNFSNLKSVDKLLNHALLEIDPEKQVMLWEQAQIKILDERVVYPLFDINNCVLRKKFVDYGHPLISTLTHYPQFDETTNLNLRVK